MKINLLAMDVDGTMTDGGIYVSGSGEEFKRFDIQDGMGLTLFHKSGGKLALLSGRYSAASQRRAEELKFDIIANGIGDKLSELQRISKSLGLSAEQVCYIGDDINDVDCIRWAGFGVAVANAIEEVKTSADYVTHRSGGQGALREVVDLLLQYGE